MPTPIALVVEDELSLSVAEKVIGAAAGHFAIEYRSVERGGGNIQRKFEKYVNGCHAVPHVVFTDLDQHPCPARLREAWRIARLPDRLLFSVAIREIEAWVMADRAAFAAFIGVPDVKVPAEPETLQDPKQTLVNLARRSRYRRLVTELVPRQGSVLSIGPLYNERLSAFVRDAWRPNMAAQRAPSLSRVLSKLVTFPGTASRG